MAAISTGQRFLALLLPEPLFEALETGTRTFAFECPCGEVRCLWECGGVKGGGNRERSLSRCPSCDEMRWHHKRKKTPAERLEFMSRQQGEPVFLSGHAWYATLLTWIPAVALWSAPMFLLEEDAGVIEKFVISIGSLLLGWVGPFFWFSTRYRLTRHTLELRSGWFGRDLDYLRITGVRGGANRKWFTVSFAFDSDWMTLGYPSRFGGYSISPRDRDLFMRMLAERCPQLELRDGELRPIGDSGDAGRGARRSAG